MTSSYHLYSMYRGCTVYECVSCPYVFEINDTTDFVSSVDVIYLCELQINDTTKSAAKFKHT